MKRLNRTVKKDQLWNDLDQRQKGRQLRVAEVIGMYAICEVVCDRSDIKRPQVGNEVKVRLDRFWPGPRGFELEATQPTKRNHGG